MCDGLPTPDSRRPHFVGEETQKIITGNVSHGRHLQTTNSGIKMVPKIRRIPCHDSVFIKQILVSKKDSLTPRIVIIRLNLSY